MILLPPQTFADIAVEELNDAANHISAQTTLSPDEVGALLSADYYRQVAAALPNEPQSRLPPALSNIFTEHYPIYGSHAGGTAIGWHQVAARLLHDAARFLESIAQENETDYAAKVKLWRERATQLLAWPQAVPGDAEFRLLFPYLKGFFPEDELKRSFPVVDIEQFTALKTHSPFLNVVRKVVRIKLQRDLDSLEKQVKDVVLQQAAHVWLSHNGPVVRDLSDEEISRIAYALKYPREAWVAPPMTEGYWTELQDQDALDVLCLIGRQCLSGSKQIALPLYFMCDRVRSCPVACYGGALLIEIQGYDAQGCAGITGLLVTAHGLLRLDGFSEPIHDFNDQTAIQLSSRDARRDYLRIFTNWVHGSEGRFQLIENPEALKSRLISVPKKTEKILRLHAKPISELPDDNADQVRLVALIAYDSRLFNATFSLHASGLIEMTDEEFLGHTPTLRSETFKDSLLQFGPLPG